MKIVSLIIGSIGMAVAVALIMHPSTEIVSVIAGTLVLTSLGVVGLGFAGGDDPAPSLVAED